MNNKEKFNKIIKNVFELSENEIIDEKMNRENTEKWNSLLHLTLVAAIEDEFNIMFDTEDILNLKSYDSGLEIINKYNPEN